MTDLSAYYIATQKRILFVYMFGAQNTFLANKFLDMYIDVTCQSKKKIIFKKKSGKYKYEKLKIKIKTKNYTPQSRNVFL